MFELRQAFEWLDSAVMYGRGEESFSGVSTDSRQIDPGSLYVPLRGERFDGHQFIDDVRARQAGGYLFESVDRIVPPAVQVPDTRRALGELARGWRAQFALPVLAVLGSNGKTTVKEMLASILVEALGEQAALATHGNLNNDIGVPLTLFRLRAEHRALVVELGMNHVGEISWLAEMARPTVAVVTNAQREHQEYLDSVAATARENGQAFAWLPADGVAVFPGDDECADIWQQQAGTRRTIRFGYDSSFEVWADSDSDPTGFEMHIDGLGQMVNLRIDGQHNVRNAMAAAATAFAAGFDAGVILRGLSQFTPAAGRMRRVEAGAGVVLIDDSYNANPDSVRAAIDVLAARPEPRILVLGDMGELGANSEQWHAEVGAYAKERGLTALLALGPMSRASVQAFGDGATHFDEMADICAESCVLAQAGVSLLVKGSRFMKMETVIEAVTSAAPQNQVGGCH
ncbi:MAG: UDP-N-acetylmuramoyl-tripeptide--D-alanyl-D-alanine ligase [Burkholderiaceae bacterium]